jgi:hypothetical protein
MPGAAEPAPPATGEQASAETSPAAGPQTAGDQAWKSLAVVVLVAAALVGGSAFTFQKWPVHTVVTPPSLTPSVEPSTPAPDPSAQIDGINTLLQSIKASRAKLPDTLGDCATVSSDIQPLEQVVRERDNQANEATNVQADGLPNGDALKQALVDMTRSTLTADQKYLDWAWPATSGGNCTDAGKDTTINHANQTAADAKRRFAELWNADAQQYGEPTYAWHDF